MAKKSNAIYSPGELDRVRGKLGSIDHVEAKRMTKILGGEIGTERSAVKETANIRRPVRQENVELQIGSRTPNTRPSRRIDTISNEPNENKLIEKTNQIYPGDDPSVRLKINYFERVKMDRYAGQMVFDIKTPTQVFTSIFSFFKEPVDYINPRFVTIRMNEYYSKIETLVTNVRNLFPKNNIRLNNQLKRVSPFVYKLLDTIRNWNIENISISLSELQSHPRSITVTNFSEILRGIYKPLFILDDVKIEDIKTALKLIYKILYLQSPMEAKNKYQEVIRNIISSIMSIRRDVQFGMYPLLMKLISDRLIPYDKFFVQRRRRYMAFLNVTEHEQLNSEDFNDQQLENVDMEALKESMDSDESESIDPDNPDASAEASNDPKVIARKAKEDNEKMEQKAQDQGQSALEALFPKAGWEKLGEYPDLYPYFANVYNLKRGYELIAYTDPLHQISILMHILEDIFYGMRYVEFGAVRGADGKLVNINEDLSEIVNNWRGFIDKGYVKEYLPRLTEYCRMLENTSESRTSIYAKKYLNELHWIKRLYFLPFYKFDSITPPPFQKQDITPIYTEIRKLRKHLTSVAVGIENGTRAGGAAAKAVCEGIKNPWESYNFQVPNSISKRLDMLLHPDKRINSVLIFFSLSTIAVLDFIVNNENSWTYGDRPGPLFRSVKGEGIIPMFGVDNKLDADKIFKDSLKKT